MVCGPKAQYIGIKHADDTDDAFHLADLQRLNILPKAYVYDPKLRPVRDLLRRRGSLVHQRTALLLSFKSLYARTTGQALNLSDAKKLEPKEATKLYEHPANQLIAQVQTEHIQALEKSIARLEKAVLACAREIPLYEKLLTIPGVGKILGMTITMEVGADRTIQNRWRLCQLLPEWWTLSDSVMASARPTITRSAATNI